MNSRTRRNSSHRLTRTKWQKYGEQKRKRNGMTVRISLSFLYVSLRALSSSLYVTELERKKKGGASTGLASFYRKMLDENEQKHEETVVATQSVVKGPQGPSPNLTITKPPDYAPKSDLDLARIAREQGKDVELNDDNQIVDKRELLSAGLNLSAPNTRMLGLRTATKLKEGAKVEVHQAVGTAASRREIIERRKREITKQLEEEQERLVKDRERQDSETVAKYVARRNADSDIHSARERYLERKRRKLEHPPAESEDGSL